MSNPLRMFRKYQASFLVAFGVMLMVAFVVGPIVSDYLSSRAGVGGGTNPLVVSWKGGELREADMANLRTVHLLATRFLRELVSRVMVVENDVVVERKGEKIKLVKGRTYPLLSRGFDDAGRMSFQIAVDGEGVMVPERKEAATDPQVLPVRPRVQLIAEATGEEELVQRTLLAQEANKLGVVVGEDAVLDYLDNLCDVTEETRPDYAMMLRNSTNGRLDMRRFVGHMSMELAAQRMLIMSQGGLYAVPPEVLYECYNKLNRRITAELLAVDVRDFSGQVGEPTDEDVLALYEEGKSRFPFPTAPEPGFKQRKKIAFQFVAGTYDEFLQREIDRISPTITDEEIEKYYADNKDSLYKIVELPEEEPADATQSPDSGMESTDATPEEPASPPGPSEGAKEDAKTEPAKVEPEKTEPEKTESPRTDPVETEPAQTEPAQTEPAKTEPAKTEAGPDGPGSGQPAEKQPPATDPGAGQQVVMPPGALLFVSYQDPDAPGGDAAQATEPAKSPAPGGETPVPPGGQDPGPEATQTESDAAPADSMTEGASPDASKQDASAEAAAATGGADQQVEKPVQYKPLDDERRVEIRETLSRQKARPIAQEKLEAAIDQVLSKVEKYARDLSFQALPGREAPEPLDFAALAREHMLTFGETPKWDTLDITTIRQQDPQDSDPPMYALARATETVWSQAGQYRRSLADVAFEGDIEQYVPRKFVDGIVMPGAFPIPPQRLFLYWRMEEVPEQTPALEDVREEVIRAWKMRQALPLAQAKAEEMAQQARRAGQPLGEVFPESAASVIRTMQFSWMTRGSMPGGTGGTPMLSPVNGLANDQPVNVPGAGNTFMRSVFRLNVGEVGTATNEPERFVYVVRVENEDLTDEQRREAFYMAGVTPEINSLVQDEQAEVIRDWFDGIEQDYAVKWERDADNRWNVEP